METAFLMICKPLFDRCLCVCMRACVCLWDRRRVLQDCVVVRCWYDYQEDEESVCASYV